MCRLKNSCASHKWRYGVVLFVAGWLLLAAAHPVGAQVAARPLAEVAVDAVGIQTFDDSLWHGWSFSEAHAALMRLRALPPVAGLAPILHEVLTTPASPPRGAFDEGAFLAARLQVLQHYGFTDAAWQVLQQADARKWPWAAAVPLLFSVQPRDTACSEVALYARDYRHETLDKARLACLLHEGNSREAALLAAILREQGITLVSDNNSETILAALGVVPAAPVAMPAVRAAESFFVLWPTFLAQPPGDAYHLWLAAPHARWLQEATTQQGIALNSFAHARQVRGLPSQSLQAVDYPTINNQAILAAIQARHRGKAVVSASLAVALWQQIPILQQEGFSPALTAAFTAYDAFGYSQQAEALLMQLLLYVPPKS